MTASWLLTRFRVYVIAQGNLFGIEHGYMVLSFHVCTSYQRRYSKIPACTCHMTNLNTKDPVTEFLPCSVTVSTKLFNLLETAEGLLRHLV